jgi:hypothetical protein
MYWGKKKRKRKKKLGKKESQTMTGTLGPRIPHKAEVLKYWILVLMISGSTSR